MQFQKYSTVCCLCGKPVENHFGLKLRCLHEQELDYRHSESYKNYETKRNMNHVYILELS